ncbi:uncharacterized protein RCH25_038024 [Pelodytes ibericus]
MPKRGANMPAVTPFVLTPATLPLLKRAQLQQHCKRLCLNAGGKNVELVQRLRNHLKQTAAPEQMSPKTPTSEETVFLDQSERQAWCVIHGQQLTTSRWVQLSLRCGRVCVSSEGRYVSLHLLPSSLPTPSALQDNLICGECLDRNIQKDLRLSQTSTPQDKCFPAGENGKSTTQGIARVRNKSGRFKPQEDPEYARRVDEILGQMATGQVALEKVLQPICPAVVHSPIAKQENSPVPIRPCL